MLPQGAPDTIELFIALSVPEGREEAARGIAERCAVEQFLLMVRDPEVGILVPAPGFPPTLRGGASWREFLKQCAIPGRHRMRVEMPLGRERDALCVHAHGLAAILLGGPAEPGELATVERLLPMLAHALQAEHRARISAAAAADARGIASRAEALATALEASRAEQARLNAKLREEHRRKDDFLAMLAHELRNPLTPLVTSIELLRRAGSAPERHLDIMARQVRQLSRLVEDLLDVSRVSRGRIELRRTRLALDEVAADAVEAARPVLEARRHVVTLERPPSPIFVHGDNVRLTQVFSNLLHNAAKYTDPGGRIALRVWQEGQEARAEVSDNGVGIEPSLLDSVFDLFAQAPVSLARAQGGLGIGLTLVRALVELHGGSVSARSDGIGRGSSFLLRLPLAVETDMPARTPATPAAHEESPLRVLIVDDNEDAADSLADILRLLGHHAEVAYSGMQALQLAADVDADVILLDIGLPEMDGYEVARRLRRTLPRDVRLVALTGYGAAEDKRRAREAGFDAHVVKPVMPETIPQLLRTEPAASPAAS